MMNEWIEAFGRARKHVPGIVSYLSAEFLIGPQLGNNLLNVGDIRAAVEAALSDLGHDLDTLLAHEPEPGLGNGGFGRLAACYMESLATLNIPAIGYGIRYEFGLFDQEIQNGWQVEKTDKWLSLGNPWETSRPEISSLRWHRRPHRAISRRARSPPRALDSRACRPGHRQRHRRRRLRHHR